MYTSRQVCTAKLIRVLAVVTFIFAGIGSVEADPIVVNGSATLVSGVVSDARGPVNLTGTNFSASVTAVNGNFGLGDCSSFLAGINGPCTSGNVSWTSIGTDITGTFTVNGVTLTSNIENQLNLMFSGPTFVIPAELLGASAVQITAPFSFSGSAASPALSEVVMLQGQGTVHVILVRRTIGLFTGFYLERADYVFGAQASGVTVEEIPEPATLLLLVSGLTGSAVYLKKKRRVEKGANPRSGS